MTTKEFEEEWTPEEFVHIQEARKRFKTDEMLAKEAKKKEGKSTAWAIVRLIIGVVMVIIGIAGFMTVFH